MTARGTVAISWRHGAAAVLLLANLGLSCDMARADDHPCLNLPAPAALPVCEDALTVTPSSVPIARRLAHLRLTHGDSPSALNLYVDLANRLPDDAEAQFELGAAYGTFNMNREAILPLERAVQLRPDYLVAYQVLAIAYGFTGNRAGAFAALSAAAELGSATDMYEIGMMHLTGNGVATDPARAVTWIRRAAEGGHIGAMQKLAELYAQGRSGILRDANQAREWLRRMEAAEAMLDAQNTKSGN